jgi:hypothetical protein
MLIAVSVKSVDVPALLCVSVSPITNSATGETEDDTTPTLKEGASAAVYSANGEVRL